MTVARSEGTNYPKEIKNLAAKIKINSAAPLRRFVAPKPTSSFDNHKVPIRINNHESGITLEDFKAEIEQDGSDVSFYCNKCNAYFESFVGLENHNCEYQMNNLELGEIVVKEEPMDEDPMYDTKDPIAFISPSQIKDEPPDDEESSESEAEAVTHFVNSSDNATRKTRKDLGVIREEDAQVLTTAAPSTAPAPSSNTNTNVALKIDSNLYSCDLCDTAYLHKWQLYEHTEQEHKEPPLPVPLKGKVPTEAADKSLLCNTCGKSFTSTPGLNMHIARCLSEFSRMCEFCGITINDPKHLCAHRARHKRRNNLIACKICGKVVVEMAEHVRLHRNKEKASFRVACDLCGRRMQKTNLKKHFRKAH